MNDAHPDCFEDTDAREHRRLFWLGFLIGTFNAVFLGAVAMGLLTAGGRV